MPDILVRAKLRSTLLEPFQCTGQLSPFILPLSATIDTRHSPAHLAAPPLLETVLVEVLTASGLAPHDLLVGFHVEDADWTFALNRLANNIAS